MDDLPQAPGGFLKLISFASLLMIYLKPGGFLR